MQASRSGSQGLLASVRPEEVGASGGSRRTYATTPRSNGVDALRYWVSGRIGQLPTGKGWEDKRLGIIIAGYEPPQFPLVAEISDFDRTDQPAKRV